VLTNVFTFISCFRDEDEVESDEDDQIKEARELGFIRPLDTVNPCTSDSEVFKQALTSCIFFIPFHLFPPQVDEDEQQMMLMEGRLLDD
jgi:hypothetical protein